MPHAIVKVSDSIKFESAQMPEWSKGSDSSSDKRELAWVRTPLCVGWVQPTLQQNRAKDCCRTLVARLGIRLALSSGGDACELSSPC